MIRTILNQEQWERIAPELPGKVGDPGATASDNRLFVEAVLWIARTGAPWRDLPREFGKWYSIYTRFWRWEPGALWDALLAFDHDSRQSLFAHCVGLTVNAVSEVYNRRPKAIAHADRLAQALALDMAAVGWRPTVDNYLGRITKGRIVEAVREAKSGTAAEHIRPLKKVEMAKAAEDLLNGSGWLPEPLRTPGQIFTPGIERDPAFDATGEARSAHDGGEQAMDESRETDDASGSPAAAAAVAAE